jgi:hypothetical protein
MRRPLDGAGAEAQLYGHGVVMQRGVAAIFLVGQHLPRLAQGAAQDEGRVEAHGGGLRGR